MLDRWGKDTFPGAPKEKATRNGANNMIEEKQSLLATFLANDRLTKSLAAEYRNYMNNKMLELQFGKGKSYDLYKVWLLTQTRFFGKKAKPPTFFLFSQSAPSLRFVG